MLVEGRGNIEPSPETITLSRAESDFFREKAAERNRFRGYGHRQDAWGRGFVKDPVFIGFLGEHALCTYLNRRLGLHLCVDTTLRSAGDGGCDIAINGLILQVKTRGTSSKRNLVRRVDERKRLRSLDSDVFVFAQLVSETAINLLGWIDCASSRRVSKHLPSRVGQHWNLEINGCDLEPMSRLIRRLEIRSCG